MPEIPRHRRRSFLQGAGLIASFSLFPSLAAYALEGEAQRKQFQYQETPKDGKQCSGCALFKPPADDKSPGGCQIIPGPISPTGWCIAWAAKPA